MIFVLDLTHVFDGPRSYEAYVPGEEPFTPSAAATGKGKGTGKGTGKGKGGGQTANDWQTPR